MKRVVFCSPSCASLRRSWRTVLVSLRGYLVRFCPTPNQKLLQVFQQTA